jgi:hypothetical protein
MSGSGRKKIDSRVKTLLENGVKVLYSLMMWCICGVLCDWVIFSLVCFTQVSFDAEVRAVDIV